MRRGVPSLLRKYFNNRGFLGGLTWGLLGFCFFQHGISRGEFSFGSQQVRGLFGKASLVPVERDQLETVVALICVAVS